jgi:hypothetical protein
VSQSERVEIARRAMKVLERLSRPDQQRVRAAIDLLSNGSHGRLPHRV